MRLIDAARFVEAYRHVQALAHVPEGIVIRVAPAQPVGLVGAHEDAPEPLFVHRALRFRHRRLHVLRRHHGDAEHLLRRGLRKVVQPVVVGPGYGRGQLGVETVDAEHEQPARGKEKGQVEPLLFHGHDLTDAVEVALGHVAVFLLERGQAVVPQVRVLRPPRDGEDLAVQLDAQIPEIALQALGGAVLELRVDIALPEVVRLEHVHIGIHSLEALLSHFLLRDGKLPLPRFGRPVSAGTSES